MMNRVARTGRQLRAAAQLSLAAVLAAAGAAGVATAQDAPDNRFYIAPMFSYVLADTDRQTDDGIGYGLSIGRRLTSGLDFELTGSFTDMDPDAGGDSTELVSYGAALRLYPARENSRFYGILQVMHNEGENHPSATGARDYDSTIADFGVGSIMKLYGPIDLRVEALYRFDSHDENDLGGGGVDGFYEPVLRTGLSYKIGKDPNAQKPEEEVEEVEVVEVAPPPPADTDGDGVIDDNDQCPDTPAGQAVDSDGCSLDSDGDGVLNTIDECPNTPAGAQVLANGCALTGDCRIPKPGEEVDENGCAVITTVVLRGVTFEFDKATLTPNARLILDEVADALLSVDEVNIELAGHTDSRGSQAYNQGLSERRATSVKDYLVERGVNASTMTTVGYGETQPVASNDTDEGRALNRRVELRILEEEAGGATAGGFDDDADDFADDDMADDTMDDDAMDDDTMSDDTGAEADFDARDGISDEEEDNFGEQDDDFSDDIEDDQSGDFEDDFEDDFDDDFESDF